jgi:phosphoglycolate phosphatase-like HAD superfamily hydrolase
LNDSFGEKKLSIFFYLSIFMADLKAIVFDLDGTLVDSKIDYDEMAFRVRDFLVTLGIPEEKLSNRYKIYRFILGGEEVFQEFRISNPKYRAIQKTMNNILNKVEMEHVDLVERMPNALEILNFLKGNRYFIGISTRGSHEYAIKSLKLTELLEFIDAILARDRVEYPKPDPRHLRGVLDLLDVKPQEAIYIGDTPTDLRTARAAEVEFYGYKRNEEKGRRLIEAGCDKILDDLMDIKVIIEKH